MDSTIYSFFIIMQEIYQLPNDTSRRSPNGVIFPAIKGNFDFLSFKAHLFYFQMRLIHKMLKGNFENGIDFLFIDFEGIGVGDSSHKGINAKKSGSEGWHNMSSSSGLVEANPDPVHAGNQPATSAVQKNFKIQAMKPTFYCALRQMRWYCI